MNQATLRACVALMEEFGDGTARYSARRKAVVVRCGRDANGRYAYRFVLNQEGQLPHGIGKA